MNHLLSDVFSENTIRPQEKSIILQGHFPGKPIVPGVILELFGKTRSALRGIDLSGKSIECNFDDTVEPDDSIDIVSNNAEAIEGMKREKSTPAFSLSVCDDIALYRGDFEPTYEQDTDEVLDGHLLQSGGFRLASFGNCDAEGNIFGYFELPDNHPLFDGSHGFGKEILQESANQVISLAHSKSQNRNGVKDGKTILLKRSRTTPLTRDKIVYLTRGNVLYVMGKILPNVSGNKRQIQAVFTGYNEEFDPLFSAEISGIEIPTKLLLRKG